MRTRVTPLSPFGRFLTTLCERQGKNLYGVGLQIGITSRSRMSYCTRPRWGKPKGALMTVGQIRKLARALRCEPDEEVKLMILGLLEYAPPVLGAYMTELEREAAEMRKELGRPAPRFRLG